MSKKGRAVKKKGETWHSIGINTPNFERLRALSDKRGLSVAFILNELIENHFKAPAERG